MWILQGRRLATVVCSASLRAIVATGIEARDPAAQIAEPPRLGTERGAIDIALMIPYHDVVGLRLLDPLETSLEVCRVVAIGGLVADVLHHVGFAIIRNTRSPINSPVRPFSASAQHHA